MGKNPWELLKVAKLDVLLKPCVRHNNPAHIDAEIGLITCNKCRCYFTLDDYGSWEEAVREWNDRPYVEGLMGDYVMEVKENSELRARYKNLIEGGMLMSKVIVDMRERKTVYLPDQERAYDAARWFKQIEKEVEKEVEKENE